MGIQINGQTDIISATDGSLTVQGADLPSVTNLNASGIITATSFSGSGANLTGIVSGVGINTAGGVVGTGATIIDFRGAGISTVTVASGIATVNIAGSSAPTGAGGDQIFYENGQTVTANYTLTTGKNAMSAGPLTINSGITVTVPSGSSWVVV